MEKPLTRNIRPGEGPLGLAEYVRAGGYQSVRKAFGMAPAAIISLVKESGLRGRGGAGFPTGLKWSTVPAQDANPGPHYLVANADEMEPGTFKDRLLLEGDPHQLLEGMIVSAYAVGAERAFLFLRNEYAKAEEVLRRAIGEAMEAGYLGRNILGSGFDLRLDLHMSAGRYMCGEETGLLNALEGKRVTPRSKPPHPTVSGLWGRPTVVQNVETLCNVPHIVNRGAAWFKGLSFSEDGGTKLYGASGRVRRPGSWELPMGTSLRELLEEHAGGMRDGVVLRGVLPGGASTAFLTPEHLDVKLDFSSLPASGSRLGTGALVVLDDRTCPVGFLLNLEKFFARESCGWCTPCREGLPRVAKILDALEKGQGKAGDLSELERHARFLGPGLTFCALAPGAADPLSSGLRHFREDFERHVSGKGCPQR
jgi:NADH-quinone oxidoreductase subunit F